MMQSGDYFSTARIDVRSNLYANIAMDNYIKYMNHSEDIQNRLKECQSKDEACYLETTSEFREKRQAHEETAFSTIIYSAMCFEAAIYDHTADYFGEKYTSEHLDKLDLLSKWVIVPKLTWNKQIRKDHAPFHHLAGLVKARNKLVHHKSLNLFPCDEAKISKIESNAKQFRNDVQCAIKALILVSLELDWLSEPPKTMNPLPSFKRHRGWPEKRYPEELEELVSTCKNLFSKSIQTSSHNRRNSLCTCDSGKRYKHCCGNPA